MKKIICLAILLIAMGLNANAQTVITNDYSSSNGSVQSQVVSSNEDIQEQASDLAFSYHAIEHGWGLSMDMLMNYFVFGYGMYWGEKGDYLSSNDGFEIYIGGNYRYRFTENLFVDARILGGYYSWTAKYKGKGGDEDKTKEGFVGLSPMVGAQFGKVAISVGYRWDWVKFKFKKENCLDRFTASLAIVF